MKFSFFTATHARARLVCVRVRLSVQLPRTRAPTLPRHQKHARRERLRRRLRLVAGHLVVDQRVPVSSATVNRSNLHRAISRKEPKRFQVESLETTCRDSDCRCGVVAFGRGGGGGGGARKVSFGVCATRKSRVVKNCAELADWDDYTVVNARFPAFAHVHSLESRHAHTFSVPNQRYSRNLIYRRRLSLANSVEPEIRPCFSVF